MLKYPAPKKVRSQYLTSNKNLPDIQRSRKIQTTARRKFYQLKLSQSQQRQRQKAK